MTPEQMKTRISQLESAAQGVLDWADLALKNPSEFDSAGVRNLDGPAFDVLRAAIGDTEVNWINQVYADLILSGICCCRRNSDGSIERVDPADIILKPETVSETDTPA